MTGFVAAAAVLTLLAVGAVLLAPRLQRRAGGNVSQGRANAAVLRQQLAELERERDLGLLDDAEYGRSHEELQRRLLSEAEAATDARAFGSTPPRRALFVVAAALPLAAALLYQQFGHPQLLGAPAALLPTEGVADGGGGAALRRIEVHLAAAPSDARAWVMLARARMQRDQFAAAADAYRRALDASAQVARDPLVWCEYADALGMSQQGRLAGRPRELIEKALALDATHPRALEMAGSAAYEAGDFRAAARFWKQLLSQLAAESGEHGQLAAAIARAEQRAKFSLPAS
jgi:cytochrome c-type biogenesis protein CcmH